MPATTTPNQNPLLSKTGSSDSLANHLFFIVGAPRSGTTLLQRILSAHSNMYIPPETEFFMKFATHLDQSANNLDQWNLALTKWFSSKAWLDQQIDSAELRYLLAERPRSAKNAFLAMMRIHAQNAGKTHLGEKSPHHCRHIKTILAYFPDAKFIHLIRDPRDVVASRLNMPWSNGSHLAVAKEWLRIVQQHFNDQKSLPPETYTFIRYEDLVTNPESEITRLCHFLGEPFEPEMLHTDRASAPGFNDRENPWKDRASQPLSTSRIATYTKLLNNRLIASIDNICTPYMQELGYEPTNHSTKWYWAIQNTIDLTNDTRKRWQRTIAKIFIQKP